jgi:hypothetical protein
MQSIRGYQGRRKRNLLALRLIAKVPTIPADELLPELVSDRSPRAARGNPA